MEVEAEEGVYQACLLLLGEVLRQGGVEAAGEDGLELVNQVLLDGRSGAVGHPDEEEWVVAAPVLLTIAKDPTCSPNNTFKLLCVPEEKFIWTNKRNLAHIFCWWKKVLISATNI